MSLNNSLDVYLINNQNENNNQLIKYLNYLFIIEKETLSASWKPQACLSKVQPDTSKL